MVTIELEGAEQANRQLLRLQQRVGNLSPILGEIGEHMVNSTHDNFESSTAPDGTPWASNSPVTFAEIGTNMVYGAMMHFGGSKSAYPNLWGDIPARPYLGMKAGDKPILLQMVGQYLMLA